MANPIILKVYDGGQLKLARAFREGQVRLGSGSVDLVLEGEGIAPHHAVIEFGALGAVIRSLSAAPLFVNGQPVLAAPLRHGDLLTIGELRVMVEMRAATQAHKPPSGIAPPATPRPHLQLIHGEEGPERPASILHATPALAVVREGDAQDLLATLGPELAELNRAELHPEAELVAPGHRPVAPPAPAPALRPTQPRPRPRSSAQPILPRPNSLEAGKESCAQVEMFWGDTRISVWHLAPGEELLAGSGAGCAALLPGTLRSAVVRSDATGWVLCAPQPLSLSLIENGATIGGQELLARGRGQADARGLNLPLPIDAVGVIAAGAVELRVRRVGLPTRAPKEPQDWKGVLAASVAAALFVGLMHVLSYAIPLPVRPPPMPEVIRPRAMIVRAALKPVDPTTPHDVHAKAQGRLEPGKAVARHSGLEGEAGNPNSPRRNARAERKTDLRALVANAGLLKALGSGSGPNNLFGVALERGTSDALGHLVGPRAADAHGSGGMGLRSLGGQGGGGDGSGLGLARIGTNGIGGGVASYGEGKGGLKGKSDATIGLTPGTPQVVGHIDPELIRKVVHDHRAQIRTCYEVQLNSRPDLAGKLVAAWTIDAQGDVTEAHTQESALHDRAVEACVSSKIKTWRFPIPKGGGEVFVTYPFIFTPGG